MSARSIPPDKFVIFCHIDKKIFLKNLGKYLDFAFFCNENGNLRRYIFEQYEKVVCNHEIVRVLFIVCCAKDRICV